MLPDKFSKFDNVDDDKFPWAEDGCSGDPCCCLPVGSDDDGGELFGDRVALTWPDDFDDDR